MIVPFDKDANNEDNFYVYLMDSDGRYDSPKKFSTRTQYIDLLSYISDHVESTHEIRVTDSDDDMVFHVVEQVLIFPLLDGMSKNNKWNPETRKFRGII